MFALRFCLFSSAVASAFGACDLLKVGECGTTYAADAQKAPGNDPSATCPIIATYLKCTSDNLVGCMSGTADQFKAGAAQTKEAACKAGAMSCADNAMCKDAAPGPAVCEDGKALKNNGCCSNNKCAKTCTTKAESTVNGAPSCSCEDCLCKDGKTKTCSSKKVVGAPAPAPSGTADPTTSSTFATKASAMMTCFVICSSFTMA